MRASQSLWLYNLSEAIIWQASEDGCAIAKRNFGRFKEKTPLTADEQEAIIEDYLDWVYSNQFGWLMEEVGLPWEGAREKMEAAIG